MSYRHTQTAPLYLLLLAFALLLGVNSWVLRGEPLVAAALAGAAVFMAILAMSFRELTVADRGDCLDIRFGPLPLFGTRLCYSTMTSVEYGRSSLIDGWGIHYQPGSGWIYNLWGFDCVTIRCGNQTVRVGTDDPVGLAAFLSEKIRQSNVLPR